MSGDEQGRLGSLVGQLVKLRAGWQPALGGFSNPPQVFNLPHKVSTAYCTKTVTFDWLVALPTLTRTC